MAVLNIDEFNYQLHMVWTCARNSCDPTCDSIVFAGLWKQVDMVKQNCKNVKAVKANGNCKDGMVNQNTR